VFEATNPGHRVRFNFGPSSVLRTQIQQGAPADVFASADWAQMQPLVDGKQAALAHTFARNRLVLVVPARNPGSVRSLRDLARRGLRVITTGEAVPIGRYTQEMLGKLSRMSGYGADFAARVNANIVSREANVRSLVAKIELGEADAAVVYETDARLSRRMRALPIPSAANVVAEYPIAVAAATADRAGAEAFVRLVRSSRGRDVLRRFGFR
jgi:molybdate transport system substrate-binding protein